MSSELLTENYDFHLPQEQIATTPANPKDSAKLLVYNKKTDQVTHTTFKELLHYIPKECAVVINDTKVIKARLFGHKLVEGSSGGKVELLFNKPLPNKHFLVLIKGKVLEGTWLIFDEALKAKVEKRNSDGSRTVTFWQNGTDLDFEALEKILQVIGHIPLPHYMQREDTKEDETDYQTIFANKAGAVAAPTASLHFTPALFDALQAKHQIQKVTLHVGAGTFKPVESSNILEHPMHSEVFAIPKATQTLLQSKTPLLAIGTTVTRTVEYYERERQSSGECNLFLHPQNPPLRVNHLLTNFHLPKSTLIMLVSSFIGREKTLELYENAKQENYRFYSYGDAMLIL